MKTFCFEFIKKAIYLVFLILMAIVSSTDVAGAQVTNIRQLFEEEGSCPLPTVEEVLSERSASIGSQRFAAPPPPPPPPSMVKKQEIEVAGDQDFLDKNGDISTKYKRILKEHFQTVTYIPTLNYGNQKFFQNENHLWGLRNEKGEEILTPQFRYVETNKNWDGFLAIKEFGDKFNYYNEQGQPLFANSYHSIRPLGDFFEVTTDTGKGVLNKEGKEIIPPIYKKGSGAISDGKVYFFASSENDLLLIVDENGEERELGIPYKYRGTVFEDRYLFYSNRLIDLETNEFLLCDPSLSISSVLGVNDVFFIQKGKFTYHFYANGDLVVPNACAGKAHFTSVYTTLGVFENPSTSVGSPLAAKYGVINKDFEWVIPPSYSSIGVANSNAGLFTVMNDYYKWGVIDSEGKVIVPIAYGHFSYHEDFIYAYTGTRRTPGTVSVFDIQGEKLGTYEVSHRGLTVHTCGEEILFKGIPLEVRETVLLNNQYEEIYGENIFYLKKLGDVGMIAEYRENGVSKTAAIDCKGEPFEFMIDGNPEVEMQYVDDLFATEFAHIQTMDGRRYLYNLKSDNAYLVDENITGLEGRFFMTFGLIRAKRGAQLGLLNLEGEKILPFSFEAIGGANLLHRTMALRAGERHALLTWTGDLLLSQYKYHNYFRYNMFTAMKEGKQGVVDYQGNVIVPFQYEKIEMKGYFIETTNLTGEKTYYGIDGEIISVN